MIEVGWGQDNPAYRQLFTNLLFPSATPEQIRSFNDLQRMSCSPLQAAHIVRSFSDIDASALPAAGDVSDARPAHARRHVRAVRRGAVSRLVDPRRATGPARDAQPRADAGRAFVRSRDRGDRSVRPELRRTAPGATPRSPTSRAASGRSSSTSRAGSTTCRSPRISTSRRRPCAITSRPCSPRSASRTARRPSSRRARPASPTSRAADRDTGPGFAGPRARFSSRSGPWPHGRRARAAVLLGHERLASIGARFQPSKGVHHVHRRHSHDLRIPRSSGTPPRP